MINSARFALITVLIALVFFIGDLFSLTTFIFTLIAIFIITAIWSGNETAEKNNNYKVKATKVLENLEDFTPENITLSNISDISMAFDSQRKKICFVDALCKPWVYDYDKIIASEIVVDGQTITKQSGTIGRSIVGGLLAGSTGAIIGGTTGSTTSNEKINSILVKITINEPTNPIFKIIFLNVPTEKRSLQYNMAFSASEKLHGIIAGAIKQTDTDMAKKPIENLSIADELVKLKKLLDEGILTNEEFENQKKKLLGIN